MNANKSVTASFTANTYSLTISAVNGSVTATPSKTTYSYGDVVTLQAVPNTGYTFGSWSATATGTANPTTITINANKSVTANFTANTYTLTITAVNGTVTATPSKTAYPTGCGHAPGDTEDRLHLLGLVGRCYRHGQSDDHHDERQ